MNDLEREYTIVALAMAKDWLHVLPPHVQHKIKLAWSAIESHGTATSEELKRELGPNWVIARRGRRIVERYGANVRCISRTQYEKAIRQAIEKRIV